MTNREINQPRIRLNDRIGEEPMTMDMQQFFEFSFWMAEELLDLEARFADWSTSTAFPILIPNNQRINSEELMP